MLLLLSLKAQRNFLQVKSKPLNLLLVSADLLAEIIFLLFDEVFSLLPFFLMGLDSFIELSNFKEHPWGHHSFLFLI